LASTNALASVRDESQKPFSDLVERTIGDAAPGFAMAIVGSENTVEATRGWAVSPEADLAGAPMTADTRIHVASCSKPITSIALFHVLDERGLDETATLGALLPDRKLHGDIAVLTLAELLTHRSGLVSQASLDDLLQTSPVPPAQRSRQYDNVNFTLLRLVIEGLTGEAYEDRVRRTVLAPAGVTSGHTSAPADVIATSYRLGASTGGRPINFDFAAAAGPYGWYLTARELAQIAQAFSAGKITSLETRARILQREFGWDSNRTPAGVVHCHGGRWIGSGGVGAVSGIAIYPDGRGAGFVMNANSPLGGGDLLADIYSQTTPMIFSYSVPDSGEATIHLTRPVWADSVRFTLDGSPPTSGSSAYDGVIRVPTPGRLTAVAYRGGQPISSPLSHDLKVVRRG